MSRVPVQEGCPVGPWERAERLRKMGFIAYVAYDFGRPVCRILGDWHMQQHYYDAVVRESLERGSPSWLTDAEVET